MNNSTIEPLFVYPVDDFATLLFINRIIYCGYFLFLILAGTCGNLLTAITLLRTKLRKYTTCQFMAVCALLNIGVLLTNTLNMMLSQGHGIHLRSLFDLGWCRLNAFVAQWIRGMASWILVIVAFDRFRQTKTLRRTSTRNNYTVLYTMFITSLILLILNLHYLLFTGSEISLNGNTPFLACIFYKQSKNYIQRFFASTSTWQELVTIIIVPCILTLILNIFIIKKSYLNPVSNEHLKSRSKSRTRRVTTMLLTSNIGFLALVGPAQIFYALSFDPQRDMQSPDEYKSFMIQGNIYQCLINTYYAASFVFCFASSSIFRREIKKLLHKQYKSKRSMNHTIHTERFSSPEHRPFIHSGPFSGIICPNNSRSHDYALESIHMKRGTQSTTVGDGFIEQ
ncbi:unnamed protein product [Rotaria sp. Silwood1]|nr:unnamed protein product [Rotaria sp. Silwood1]CAF0936099.1 unnamed protein product [Rotaria sp. Silwood1]CAF1025357.1 unnamed protein product [Rotaria sp. Silwood1]CAF3343185.1 unnamed protein product [Rotaria sp. Silwood1]CAF3366164.1 unnamed protein product [Rotaria sp. Silwood1]